MVAEEHDTFVGNTWTPNPDLADDDLPSIPHDGELVGDALKKKSSDVLRVVCGNINGLQLSNGTDKLKQICQEVKSLEVDHLGLSEINCDTTNFQVNQMIHDCTRLQFHIVVD